MTIDGLQKNLLTLRLENTGTSSYRANHVRVRAYGRETAEPIFETELPAWYMLAGGVRRYAVELPPEVCTHLRLVTAVADVAGGAPVEVTRALACGN